MMNTSTPFVGEGFALLTAVFWAATSLIFARAIGRVGAMQVNITRLQIAALLLAVTIVLLGAPLALPLPQVGYLVASGIVGLVFGDSFLFKAYDLIGARSSMLVMSLAPALAALLAYVFLDERMGALAMAGAALTLTGIAVVVWDRGGRSAPAQERRAGLGLLFAFLGALGQGGNLVLAKVAFGFGEVNGFWASFLRIGSALAILWPAATWAGAFRNPWRVFAADKPARRLVLAGSIFGPYLGITTSLVAVANADVGVAATLMATVPILMLPMVRVIHREPLGWRAIGGACLAVAGVAVLFLT